MQVFGARIRGCPQVLVTVLPLSAVHPFGQSATGWTEYTYDGLGRKLTVKQPDAGRQRACAGVTADLPEAAGTVLAHNFQYDFAGRLTSWDRAKGAGSGVDERETRGYNVNGQMTTVGLSTNSQWGWNPPTTRQYNFSPTQNNGQITGVSSIYGGVTYGGTTYDYDALRRLVSAVSTQNGSPSTTDSFAYDGFGNLTSKTLSGTTMPIPVNAATNRLTNAYYDANGNMTSGAGLSMTYDGRNRLTTVIPSSGGTELYGYSPANKRIYYQGADGSDGYWVVYGARGERIGQFYLASQQLNRYSVWLGGTDLMDWWTQDRLGTKAAVHPYGEEIGTATTDDRVKFATYIRDSFSGLDYADQRYYASSYGRFNTADPYIASGGQSDPGSWNRFSYTRGDPVNRFDPRGLVDDDPVFTADAYAYPDSDTTQLSFWSLGIGGNGPLVATLDRNYGEPPAIILEPLEFGDNPVECAKALGKLVRATGTVFGRVAEIIADVKNIVKNGQTDPGHRQALAEACNALQKAIDQVRRSCLSVAAAAAAIAAAEEALAAAAPYLVVAAL